MRQGRASTTDRLSPTWRSRFTAGASADGGVQHQLTPSVAIDLGYRYLNSGATRTLVNPQTGTTLSGRATSPSRSGSASATSFNRGRTRRLTRRAVWRPTAANERGGTPGHVPHPDDVAAVRAAVLVPVPLRLQRQFRPQHAGDADPVPLRRRGRQHEDPDRLDGLRPAGDPACRRSAARSPIRTTRRSVARRLKFAEIFVQAIGGRRLRPVLAEPALSGAVRARLRRRPVRPDQVRHSARSPAARGARRRQRAGRGRDLRGDHLRPDRRRARGGDTDRSTVGRRDPDDGHRRRLLLRRPASSPRPASARRGSRSNWNVFASTSRIIEEVRADRRQWAGGAGDELVLDGRHRRAVARAGDRQGAHRRRPRRRDRGQPDLRRSASGSARSPRRSSPKGGSSSRRRRSCSS